ncbi:DoxX family protein [Mucilaginibacter sp. L3T2-6]|uniref:DoxX family protein n=1 Tax=Mucilaginibacter sp. L3T2-6 TaxID=3062491 RepID=UPI002675FA34|nr:DoxX family protein [Mucilaginibacter sp. L3T2-6]MDO3641756.1 DoxX family protein [Mucilaginibacter sp. L3T2-6]MDV6214250.1 DoxX family protein [Mucilaginibacter sp. L3T2-6]
MTTAHDPIGQQWSLQKKIGFRFVFCYALLFTTIGGNDSFPLYADVYYPFFNHFQKFLAWAGKHLFNVTVITAPREWGESGGDATVDYMLCLFILIVALLATAVWSYTGRKTKNYDKLFYWLRVLLRYFVATNMIYYGVSKLLRVQFPTITISRLMERVGDMSPMGLAWTYMSYSTAFNYFTGAAEVLCAFLLFFRRTTRLGATLGVVLMVNIVAINFCFDVCVKLFSTTLLLMCIFILIPDYQFFINFFIRHSEVPVSDITPHRFKTKWKNYFLTGMKWTLMGYNVIAVYIGMNAYVTVNNYADPKLTKPPLYGLYKVDSFEQNREKLTLDNVRWNNFWVSHAGFATIKFVDDSVKSYFFTPDTLTHTIKAHTAADPLHSFYLNYETTRPGVLILKGQWQSDSIVVKMHKVDLNGFRLISRGFHMINEFPYNK